MIKGAGNLARTGREEGGVPDRHMLSYKCKDVSYLYVEGGGEKVQK